MTLKKTKLEKKDKSAFDFENYRKEVVAGLLSGKGLTGEGGLLKPLIAEFVEAALEAELSGHLAEEKSNTAGKPNKRNGQKSKTLRTEAGEVRINYSRDRTGTFEPVTVGKRQYEMASGFDNQILELYAMSNSAADIRLHLDKMYGVQ